MKFVQTLPVLLAVLVSSAHADVLYKCSPNNDDGDRFGETLVLALEYKNLGIAPARIKTLSDYLPAFKMTRSKQGEYSARAENYAPESGRLNFVMPEAIASFPEKFTFDLQDGKKDQDPVHFDCDRISF
jgi:hypothetical protein